MKTHSMSEEQRSLVIENRAWTMCLVNRFRNLWEHTRTFDEALQEAEYALCVASLSFDQTVSRWTTYSGRVVFGWFVSSARRDTTLAKHRDNLQRLERAEMEQRSRIDTSDSVAIGEIVRDLWNVADDDQKKIMKALPGCEFKCNQVAERLGVSTAFVSRALKQLRNLYRKVQHERLKQCA